ncbi:hypothetical protein MMC20_003740 [Loxospora ochrophaea]|nr:hypothetical protein [Loxospora ochrophaea]
MLKRFFATALAGSTLSSFVTAQNSSSPIATCIQSRTPTDPSALQISSALSAANAVASACGSSALQATDGLLSVTYFQIGEYFLNVSTPSDEADPSSISTSFCSNQFDNITAQCVSGGSFWGGWISSGGTNYSITNDIYPANPLPSNGSSVSSSGSASAPVSGAPASASGALASSSLTASGVPVNDSASASAAPVSVSASASASGPPQSASASASSASASASLPTSGAPVNGSVSASASGSPASESASASGAPVSASVSGATVSGSASASGAPLSASASGNRTSLSGSLPISSAPASGSASASGASASGSALASGAPVSSSTSINISGSASASGAQVSASASASAPASISASASGAPTLASVSGGPVSASGGATPSGSASQAPASSSVTPTVSTTLASSDYQTTSIAGITQNTVITTTDSSGQKTVLPYVFCPGCGGSSGGGLGFLIHPPGPPSGGDSGIEFNIPGVDFPFTLGPGGTPEPADPSDPEPEPQSQQPSNSASNSASASASASESASQSTPTSASASNSQSASASASATASASASQTASASASASASATALVCKRDVIVETRVVETHRLGKRTELTIAGTDPLKSALDNLGSPSALDSATGIVTNRLPRAQQNAYVTGLRGTLTAPRGGINIGGQVLKGDVPWIIRWDYDPTKNAHVNAEFGTGANNPTFAYTFSTGDNGQYGQNYMLDATRQLTNAVGLDTANSVGQPQPVYFPSHSAADGLEAIKTIWKNKLSGGCGSDMGQPNGS